MARFKTRKITLLVILMAACISILYVIAVRRLTLRSLQVVQVVAAKHAIDNNHALSRKDIQLLTVLKASMPGSALQAHQVDSVMGMQLSQAIQAGDILRHSDFHDPNASALNAIPADYRIIAIPSSPENAVGGILQPGDHIDIWAQLPSHSMPRKLLSNITIWWWHTQSDVTENSDSLAGNVLVPVPQEEVSNLLHAISHGQIWLTLRTNSDSPHHGSVRILNAQGINHD